MKMTWTRCRDSLWRRAPIALAACLVGSVLLGHPPVISGQEKPDELPGRIFLGGQKGAGVLAGIIAINPRNGTWTRISEEPTTSARVSPDGRRLADFRLKRGMNRFETFITEIDGDRPPTRIFEGLGGARCWLPDGKALLFWANEDPADRSKETTLRISDDGSHREKLPLPETEAIWDCSPDGRWLLTYSSRKGSTPNPGQHLYLMRPDGKDERLLLEGVNERKANQRSLHWVMAIWGRFAPDSRRVSYIRNEGRDSGGKRDVDTGLWTVGLDGQDHRPILKGDDGGRPVTAVWSPDGKWLAVTLVTLDPDDGRATTRVEVMDTEGGHRRPIHLPEVPGLFLLDWR